MTIPLSHFLILGALLFAIGVVGIFMNRKNLIILLMAGEMAVLLWRSFGAERIATVASPPVGYSNTRALGKVLYTDYVFAFEIAAVILLVAIVAAIALTLRHRKETKYQDAATQLAATKAGRLKIVDVPSEERR